MRLTRFLLFAAFALGACAPLAIYHKQGVPVAQMQADTQACKVKALRDVPVNTQIRTTPSRYVPPRRVCHADGTNCRVKGGFFIPGEVYSFDANEPFRREVEKTCMAKRGYAPVSIPPCPAGVVQTAPKTATERLPALGPKSCAIRNNDGSFLIVERG